MILYDFINLYSRNKCIIASNSSDFLEPFLNLSNTDIFTRSFFVVGQYPVHCRVFSSIRGLYTLDASSIRPPPNTYPAVTIINVSNHWQISPGGQNCPWLRTTALFTKTLKMFSERKKKKAMCCILRVCSSKYGLLCHLSSFWRS